MPRIVETTRPGLWLWIAPLALLLLFFSGIQASPPPPAHPLELPAFPGAEGFGSLTPGGRGGKIIEVTNLDFIGPGSFTEALQTPGPRIIVFRTGGTIDLQGRVYLTEPFVTIAGQTAPGDGIVIKNGTLTVQTHDVVIRGLRFRVGDLPTGPDPEIRDGIDVWDPNAYNVIIDHCSFAWGIDENLSAGNDSHDITFSWNIIAEGLDCSLHPEGCHSKGLLHHSTGGPNYSSHHNIIISNRNRNPRIANISSEVVNNYVYNYGLRGMEIWLPPGRSANIIGNVYKPGPDTDGFPTNPRRPILIQTDTNPRTGETGGGPGTIYLRSNLGPGREEITVDDDDENWRAVETAATESVLRDTPFTGMVTTTYRATELEDILFGEDGAGAIVPYRDPVDDRVLNTALTNTGKIIDSQEEVGGWPEMDPGTPPPDADHDGMPDDWEKDHGLNPEDASDAAGDRDGDGYTNVEEYINGLFPPIPFATDVEDGPGELPATLEVFPAYPNPFNQSTTLTYHLALGSPVTLAVYDSRGALIYRRDLSHQPPGAHTLVWDGRNLSGSPAASGVYFYTLTVNDNRRTGRLVLIR